MITVILFAIAAIASMAPIVSIIIDAFNCNDHDERIGIILNSLPIFTISIVALVVCSIIFINEFRDYVINNYESGVYEKIETVSYRIQGSRDTTTTSQTYHYRKK